MKWDYVRFTVWGVDDIGSDGLRMFDSAVVKLAEKLNCELSLGKAFDGYKVCFQLRRGDDLVCQALSDGTGGAEGSSQFVAASTAHEVFPILREMFPKYGISRLDAAEDYCELGAWDRLEAILTRIATANRVAMEPKGEGHKRSDGTRDKTKGRTWYFGGKSSVLQIVLYEKGLEQIAKGVPADPNWVRVEVRVKPNSKGKSVFSMLDDLQPAMLFGMSAWSKQVGDALLMMDLKRFNVGTVWRPSDLDRTALHVATQFQAMLDELLVRHGTPEAAWLYLHGLKEKTDQAKALLAAIA